MKRLKQLLCLSLGAVLAFSAAVSGAGEPAIEDEPLTASNESIAQPDVQPADADYPIYITKSTNLNLRDAPDGEIIGVIPIGTQVYAAERDDKWTRIIWGDKTGWVWHGYLARFETNYTYPPDTEEAYRTRQIVIDVSEYQGRIDWPSVAASGVWGAVLKIGDRGYSTRKLFIDPTFEQNYNGAKSAGLHVGVYFYSTAKNEDDAREEAQFVLRLLNTYGCDLDLPVLLDEEDGTTSRLGSDVVKAVANAFCDEIEKADLPVGVYTYASWANNYMGQAFLNEKLFWLADWTGERNYDGNYLLHQFTSSGNVNGIEGDVDVSVCYFDFPAWYNEIYLPKLAQTFMLGDVDRSGRITSSDARMTLRASAKLTFLSGLRFQAADLNSDGRVTAAEARRILRYSAQLERSLTGEPLSEPESASAT